MSRYELICDDCGERVVIDTNRKGERQSCGCAGVSWSVQPARIVPAQPEDTEEVLCILPKQKQK